MTLTTHAVVGAAAASIFPTHPVLAFSAGFLSHFMIDAMPHWHYPVASFEINKQDFRKSDMQIGRDFPFDFAKIGLDVIFGILISFLLFHSWLHSASFIVLLGAMAGILPDPLQFVYWKWRYQPLTTLQRFHIWIHARRDLDHRPIFGVSLQLLLMAAAVVGSLKL
ncbi:MAG: hypothetical protein HY220_03905 [Candidatus Sungbacteria bacterium]|uniref:Uncharacterized protein n=1 Tax=Candidatus Sungiibacteriota bacterium TaxID=2750080 RepID=A0A9D6LQG9_9BACT|nr:hypothetical protein [Candidatus Sungbacteria bacterium]